MIQIFLFERYSRRILNYLEKITLYNLILMMIMVDLVIISVKTPLIDGRYLLEKEFIKLICINI